jgi:demethylmenaquinone methyltransferase/2-methoxy-6-polyprenyl-1,4-benzoquinol methylase/phosphoethanolamine N-methyltransferase
MRGLHAHETAPKTEGRTIRWASFYDTVTGLLLLGKERAIREMTVELAPVKPGDKVLDVGCGTGSLTLVAKAHAGASGEVHGIDAAPEMIDVARRKATRAGVDTDFRVGLIEDLPFPDAQFDIVLSSLMIHHLPENLKRKGFAEMNRVLKPGGRILVVDFEPPSQPLLRVLTTVLVGHGMMQTNIRDYPAMMQEAGFTDIESGSTKSSVLSFVRGRAGETRRQATRD